MDTLEEAVATLIPKSLDDIVRINRDKLRIYLTTPDEMGNLCGSRVVETAKASVSDWAFITLHLVESQQSFVYLTGFNQQKRCSWMTSSVTAIDGKRVRTTSGSIYELTGDSSLDVDLLNVCATLHLWGIGPLFGVLHIFY